MCGASDSGTGKTQVTIKGLPSQSGLLDHFFVVKILSGPTNRLRMMCMEGAGGLPQVCLLNCGGYSTDWNSRLIAIPPLAWSHLARC